jgi:hypothetical protein
MRFAKMQTIPTIAKAAKGIYAHPNIPRHLIAVLLFPLVRLRRWYRYSVVRLLLHEIRSVVSRMGWIFEIHEAERLHGRAEIRKWMASCAVTGPCTRKYILYMQRIEALYPFLSIFDSLLLTEAWKAGSESNVPVGISHGQVEIVNS